MTFDDLLRDELTRHPPMVALHNAVQRYAEVIRPSVRAKKNNFIKNLPPVSREEEMLALLREAVELLGRAAIGRHWTKEESDWFNRVKPIFWRT